MHTIKTRGVRAHHTTFDSATEAKFVQFITAIGIVDWHYHPGARISAGEDGGYEVDFYLPSLGCYVEIKNASARDTERYAIMPTRRECAKAMALSSFTHIPVFIFYGDPGDEQWSAVGVYGNVKETSVLNAFAICDACSRADIVCKISGKRRSDSRCTACLKGVMRFDHDLVIIARIRAKNMKITKASTPSA
jgi:hypothetical protein